MPDKRTQRLVKESQQDLKNFREGNKRVQADVDLTAPGHLTRFQTQEATLIEVEVEGLSAAKPRDYVETQLANLESKFAIAENNLQKSSQVFDLILKEDVTLAELVSVIGTMDRSTLDAAVLTAEGIRNSISYQEIVTDIRRKENKAQENKAIAMFEVLESQIKIARKAVKVSSDQDSLEHEIEMRDLNGETNQLKKEDKINYLSNLRERNKQLSMIRSAYVQTWTSKAVVAAHKAKAATKWSERYTSNSIKPEEV